MTGKPLGIMVFLTFRSVQWFHSGWARSSCYLVMDVMVFRYRYAQEAAGSS
jgi:hypothetical protein